jgi:sulfite reductase (NADPH) flavoprotein alpha-component
LPDLRFGVLALGDRSYQQYCAFGHALHAWLYRRHAQPLFDAIEVDNGDEGALRHWQHQLGVLSGHSDEADWSAPAYGRWRLADRRCSIRAARGSGVSPVLTPLDLPSPSGRPVISPRSGRRTAWLPWMLPRCDRPPGSIPACCTGHAGCCRTRPGGAAVRSLPDPELLAALPALPHRAYSIASLPADGALELMVRLMHLPDGRAGWVPAGWGCMRSQGRRSPCACAATAVSMVLAMIAR